MIQSLGNYLLTLTNSYDICLSFFFKFSKYLYISRNIQVFGIKKALASTSIKKSKLFKCMPGVKNSGAINEKSFMNI